MRMMALTQQNRDQKGFSLVLWLAFSGGVIGLLARELQNVAPRIYFLLRCESAPTRETERQNRNSDAKVWSRTLKMHSVGSTSSVLLALYSSTLDLK